MEALPALPNVNVMVRAFTDLATETVRLNNAPVLDIANFPSTLQELDDLRTQELNGHLEQLGLAANGTVPEKRARLK